MLNLTDLHGNGLRLKVMSIQFRTFYIKMDQLKNCNKCKNGKLMKNFRKDKKIKDGFHNHCKSCRKLYYYENLVKIKKEYLDYRDRGKEYCLDSRDRTKSYDKIIARETIYFNNIKQMLNFV